MNLERDDEPIRGAALAPVRTVRRKLVSPSGREVVVDVPVYPPFRLASDEERKLAAAKNAKNGHDGGAPRASDPDDERADSDADQADPDSAA
jgi:hypothetical protein